MRTLTSHLKEVPDCALFLKIYSHRQLLKAQRYVAENEAIGRYDHVAGLLPQLVVPPGETRGRSVPCLGSEEFLDAGKILHTLPAPAKLVVSVDVSVTNCQVFIPKREALELRMIDSLFNQYRKVQRSDIIVLARTLKVGFHNGHTVINGQWVNQNLQEDKDDRDMLYTADASMSLPNYIPDATVALVLIVEYQLGILPSRNNHIDSHSILDDKGSRSKVLSVTTLGIASYIPCDGKRLLLTNTNRAADEEGVNVEIKLFKDDLCGVLNPTHLILKTAEATGTASEEAAKAADAKARNRLSYIGEDKLRTSTNLRASTATENLDLKADVPNNLGAMVGLDLKVIHPSHGVLLDGAYVEEFLNIEETKTRKPIAYGSDDDDSPRRRRGLGKERVDVKESTGTFHPRTSGSFKVTKERFERRVADVSDHDSVAESIVTGDSERSHVRPRLSSLYYAEKGDRGRDDRDDHSPDHRPTRKDQEPSKASGLLLHSMHAKLANSKGNGEGVAIRQIDSDCLAPQDIYAPRYVASKSTVPFQRNEFFIRPMTRGAKTRLNRHGIADAIQDSAGYYLQQESAMKDAQDRGYQRSVMKKPGGIINNYNSSYFMEQRVDLYKEAEDELNINEVNIQFVGFRTQSGDGQGNRSGDSYHIAPRAIYCTYQFYACQSTRTEALALQPADPGAVHVLTRDDPAMRNEPPLVLRYVIDNSHTSLYESYEYADYLAHKSLYVDVWDADSLLFLGTVGIPCRLLMRQGSTMVKHALEIDVINGENVAGGGGGITNMTILDSGPLVGERVGSISIMLSCQGVKGRSRRHAESFRRPDEVPAIEGLNWRAHSVDNRSTDIVERQGPKNKVRARPLTETAPELSDALVSMRDQVKGTSFRSLDARRGNGGNTLNYTEVVILFKRFAGNNVSTVQYNGDLMCLMDLPSMSIMMKKLVKAYKTFGDQAAVRREALRHANSSEDMTDSSLMEFMHVLFQKTGVKSREEDRMLVASKIVEMVGSDGKYISVTKLLSFISDECDKLDWILASTRIKLCAQRAQLQGVDVEQVLADYDPTNSKFIAVKHFKEFLSNLSVHGKISYQDINLAVRMFGRRGRGLEDKAPVSLEEVLSFLGIDYVGNLQSRVRNMLKTSNGDSNDDSLSAKYVLRLLNDGKDGVNSAGRFFPYDTVITVFRSLGVFNVLSHEQVMNICKKLDVKSLGKLSAEQILGYLGVPFNAGDLSSTGGGGAQTKGLSIDVPAVDVIVDAEQLLKLLLSKVQSNGVAVDEAFRHFDTNGDGFISPQEFEQGLQQLAIFDHISNWKAQLSEIVTKFDKSNDGLVSLREFFAFLGIKDYAPNIVQRLTKIFAVATVNGLSFQDIFLELDDNKDGTLDATEMITGLKKLGTFGDINEQDAMSVVKIFDDDGDNKISLNEFVEYFQERVAQDLKLRRVKNGLKVAKRFRDVMSKAQTKGASIRDIFAHFDKDKGGSISTDELANALKGLPNLKSLSAQDITDLIQAIDIDNSGDVTLNEFEAFVCGSAGQGSGEHVSIFERIRETFAAAEAKGLSFAQAFNVIDKDGNAELSLNEFDMLLRKLPTFKNISAKEVAEVFEQIDADNSKQITVDEFKTFVKAGHADLRRHKENLSSLQSVRGMNEEKKGFASEQSTFARKVHSKDDAKELFVRHMNRISEIDGSMRGLMKHLDDDDDGLIRKAQLFNLLRREDVFESLPREEVEDLLQPFLRDEEYIIVNSFLRFLEGEKNVTIADNQLYEDYDKLISEKQYSFSHDIEVRAVEKKLQTFGRILAKRGVDVEAKFQQYDPLHTGCVGRTDFIQVISQLGIYLLEESKVMQENLSLFGNVEVKKTQVDQINRLKGYSSKGGQGYVSNIPNLARKMFQSEGRVAGGGEFKSHVESLTVIDWYRQGQKQMLLQRVLSHSLAHTVHLYPRFGKTLFFEYPLNNPFNHEERFEIEIGDPELRLVTSFDEWHHLRGHCRPAVGELGAEPAEAETFDKDGLGRPQATLLPFETFSLPFTFMTLLPYSPPAARKARIKDRGEAKDDESKGEDNEDDDDPAQRVVEVKIISGSHGHLVAILRIHLHMRPPLVHRVLRFQEYENSIAKRQVKLIAAASSESHLGDFHHQLKYIHCVEASQVVAVNSNLAVVNTRSPQECSRVVVEWGPDSGLNHDDDLSSMTMLIRYKCGEAPTAGMFYLLIYNDPHQSVLHEVWQVFVYSRLRLDVQSMVRSPSAADLVVRGDRFSRRARAFCSQSSAYSVAFKPENVFQLVPGAYNRIMTTVQPKALGHRRALINLVDVDTRELISSWLLNISSSAPAVSRAYDVVVSAHAPIYKKILFKNPWDVRRKFVLLSSDEDSMRPR